MIVATHDSVFWGLLNIVTYDYPLILLVTSSFIHFLMGTSLIHLGLRRHHVSAKLGWQALTRVTSCSEVKAAPGFLWQGEACQIRLDHARMPLILGKLGTHPSKKCGKEWLEDILASKPGRRWVDHPN